MKKILSVLLTAAMLISAAAIPVSADYTEAEYDETVLNNAFDDGTADGKSGDDGKALQIGADYADVFRLDAYPTGLDSTKEFFMSLDFKFDSNDSELNIKSDSSKDNVGPIITYDADGTKKNEKKLVTQTGSSGWQSLGDFVVNEWYTMEIEGVTGNGNSLPTCRLYNYVDGVKTLVQETKGMNFRNLGSSGRHFSYMQGKSVTVDNVFLVQERPDVIDISCTAENDEMNAGTNASLDYVMTRKEQEVTKYAVEWSIDGEPEGVSLNGTSIVADISSPTQTVTVKATAIFGEQTLIGEKEIKINSVDVSDEAFDTVVVTGNGNIKAGTSESYVASVSKNGEPVDVLDGEIVWSVYNCDNLKPNGNKGITITGGKLDVADNVLPQTVNIRASSKSGKIVGFIPVEITVSDKQTEQLYLADACERAIDTVNRVDNSIDGSTAYYTTAATAFEFGDKADYVLTELDFKVDADGSGIRLKRKDGTELSSFVLNGGNLAQQTGGSKYNSLLSNINKEKWYHFEMIYMAGTGAECNIYEYNDDGTLGEKNSYYDLNRRNDKNYGKIEVQSGTYVDNIKISAAVANEIELKIPRENMFAGETLQAEATASRNGLPIKNATGLTWEVLDEEGLPIIDENALVKISGTGLLTVDAMAPAQKITVRVTSASGHTASADVNIQTSDIFEIKNIGVNEEQTKITKLYVDKKFNYNDDVTFIIAIHGEDGILKGVSIRPMYGDSMNLGSNELTLDMSLPADFDPETDDVDVMVWTTF